MANYVWDAKSKSMKLSAGRGRPVDSAVEAKIAKAIGSKKSGTFTLTVVVGENGPDITRAKVEGYCRRNRLTVDGTDKKEAKTLLTSFAFVSPTKAEITLGK